MDLLCLIGEHRHLKAEAAGLEARRLATTGSHVTLLGQKLGSLGVRLVSSLVDVF